MILGDGPLKSALNSDDYIIKHELTTYKLIDNKVIKEVVVRDYYADTYQDSTSFQPLVRTPHGS